MEYEVKKIDYEPVYPGTMGVSQKIDSDYQHSKDEEDKESSKLVFLTKNEIMTCSQNQY